MHFAQLAMKESVLGYLREKESAFTFHETDAWDLMKDEQMFSNIESLKSKGTFYRLINTCRGIRATCKRKHACALFFEQFQK